ncbi:hypothetical protein Tcan_00773, partial [Toxocara canis]
MATERLFNRGALASLWTTVEGTEVSGGVLHCYINEYDCRSSCDYNCVHVASCEYDITANFVCLPNLIWFIMMTMLPCVCLLIFLLLLCCCCSQNCQLARYCERLRKRRQTSPMISRECADQSAQT